MHAMRRAVAATELLLVFPCAVFMTALFVRNLSPKEHDLARSAQRVVMWYARDPHVGLWIYLITLPLAVVVIGSATLLYNWSTDGELRQAGRQTLAAVRAHFASFLIAGATLFACGSLAAIAVHVLTD
jgi:ABC-type Fe3+ transport system permease subunit